MSKFLKGILILLVVSLGAAGAIALITRNQDSKASPGSGTTSSKTESNYVSAVELSRGVFSANYRGFDEDFAINYLDQQYDKYLPGGGCTAMAKQVSDGDLIVARNMDLYITNQPSYVIKTELPGMYKTIGLAYSAYSGDNIATIKKKGILKTSYNILPALQTDVMNSEGFYIEINMRNATYRTRLVLEGEEPSLYSAFSCSGTNPGKKRIMASMLPEYLGTRCSTISEALEIAQNDLDIYTPTPSEDSPMDWNFAFMMADSTGRYGVMEIARNQVNFTEGKAAEDEQSEEATLGAIQANYYLHEDFASIEEMGAGFGRVDHLSELYPELTTEEEMFDAIKQVSYFQAYDRENCLFDSKSEFVGYHAPDNYFEELEVWDDDFVTDPDNEDTVNAYIDWCKERIEYYEELGTLKDVGLFWNSTFTLTANITDKTLNIRFYEDETNILKIKLR